MHALIDRASLRLLQHARRWRTQGVCSSLPLLQGYESASINSWHLQVCLSLRRMQAPPDRASLRLLDRCKVEAHSRCVLVSAAGALTRHLHERVLAFAMEPPCKLRLMD